MEDLESEKLSEKGQALLGAPRWQLQVHGVEAAANGALRVRSSRFSSSRTAGCSRLRNVDLTKNGAATFR